MIDNPYRFLEQHAAENPDGIAMIEGATAGTEITFEQLLHATDCLATKLASLGIGPGVIVALRLDKRWYWIFTLALWRLGATSMVATSAGLDFEAFGASHVITRGETIRFSGTTILVDQEWFDDAMSSERSGRVESFTQDNPYPIIALTSGTTGRPKQIAITTELLIARAKESSARNLTDKPGLFLAGIATLYGQLWHFIFLMRGWPICSFTARPEELKDLPLAIERFGIETLSGAPGQLQAAIAIAGNGLKQAKSLKRLVMGGSIIPSALCDLVIGFYGWRILTAFASTEVGAATARELLQGDDPRNLGLPVAGAIVQIVDENDKEVPKGEIGKIRVKTDLMVDGYFNNREGTDRSFRDGWFFPGDRGRVLPSGEIYFEGREGEVINLGGLKVDPSVIDEFMLQHPAMRDTASFGIEVKGELRYLACAVVLQETVNMDELRQYAKREFGERSPLIIFNIDLIPRNEMKKVKRVEMTKKYSADLLRIIRASRKK